MSRMLIPRSRIPKVNAICPACNSTDIAVIVSAPYADGYYRRHRCGQCQNVFHTLAPYDNEEVQVSHRPFKDRELTEWEATERARWWQQEARAADVTIEVTLLTRIERALRKKEEDRTQIESYLVEMYNALDYEVREMVKKGDTS